MQKLIPRLRSYLYSSLLLTIISICIVILVVCFISYQHTPHHRVKRYHFLYFGTSIQLTISANQPRLPHSAVDKIDTLLETMHYRWHPWREGHMKQLNNKLSTLEEFQADQESVDMIMLAQELHRKSKGLFNPAIGKLIEDWGFHSDNPSQADKLNLDKTEQNYKTYKNRFPNPNNIAINSTLVKNSNPYLQLDFSGFIKAKAALEIKNILLEHNIHNALINIGGDVYVMGYKLSKKSVAAQPWIVAAKITSPDAKQNKLIKLKVHNGEAIASSGTYARSYHEIVDNKATGQKYNYLRHHIINPNTLKPADGFDSVTVVHQDPYLADAAATALLIAGPENYQSIAKSMGIEKYILYKDNSELIISESLKNYIMNDITT